MREAAAYYGTLEVAAADLKNDWHHWLVQVARGRRTLVVARYGTPIATLAVWEVGTLVRKGRLALSGPVERWVEEALAAKGVTLTPFTAGMALESAAVPDSFTGDPVDRMLLATARILGATVVTADRRILEAAGTLGAEVMGAAGG